ncbi:hypothetical protein VTL71DRAFT_4023 [Oculimacula yallundae]|uniref:Uncharacterized protein n=1 Tax=Oculimacula yallundae TaxID=86028 RepID=A0ABR4C6Z4_9HELO
MMIKAGGNVHYQSQHDQTTTKPREHKTGKQLSNHARQQPRLLSTSTHCHHRFLPTQSKQASPPHSVQSKASAKIQVNKQTNNKHPSRANDPNPRLYSTRTSMNAKSSTEQLPLKQNNLTPMPTIAQFFICFHVRRSFQCKYGRPRQSK